MESTAAGVGTRGIHAVVTEPDWNSKALKQETRISNTRKYMVHIGCQGGLRSEKSGRRMGTELKQVPVR